MPLAPVITSRPLTYSLIRGATPTGPAIGSYAGAPIAASIVDAMGRHYDYAGLAPRRPDGTLDADALRPGEFILSPGLLYKAHKPR
jgi:hypothetical protein